MSPPRREPVTCGHCRRLKKCPRLILEEPVCEVCILRLAQDAECCPGCGQVKVLAFYDTQRRAACAGCTGNPAVYACRQCGREDSPWGARCGPCVPAERVAALLAQPGGGTHPQLQPVYNVLLAGPRPQSTLYWLSHSTGPGILRSMARGDLEISHATFEARPTNRTNNYLRDLLAAVGAQVELLLHDDTIRLYTRVAGLLMLLFAQPLSGICRMRASQVTDAPNGRLHLTFDTFAVELPEPLDQLIRHQLTRRGQASYVSRPDHWLFPGGIPGHHLATENIRSQIVERGIQPLAARNAAMFQLAGQIPTPILADILGLAPHTATRWAALAARDWSQYAAQRADNPALRARGEKTSGRYGVSGCGLNV